MCCGPWLASKNVSNRTLLNRIGRFHLLMAAISFVPTFGATSIPNLSSSLPRRNTRSFINSEATKNGRLGQPIVLSVDDKSCQALGRSNGGLLALFLICRAQCRSLDKARRHAYAAATFRQFSVRIVNKNEELTGPLQ